MFRVRFKAIFFDRDGTLTYFDPEKERWRDQTVSGWSGKPFALPYDKMMRLFALASEGKSPWYKNLQDERAFFKRYYKSLLMGEGVKENIDQRAALLFGELWCNKDRALFDETVEVLAYFYHRGYKMGVISDTSPSLEYTLQQLGIAKYFTSFTASSLVGAGNPARSFLTPPRAQGVSAQESLYVDDCKPEADGAREQGFTSFWIDRTGSGQGDEWTIQNLKQLIDFAEASVNQ